ncbi:dipeptidase D [Bradyrhizobium sp. Rc2d]|nr:dipeptidase D [Bradyrhizobium sp. Rc2d]
MSAHQTATTTVNDRRPDAHSVGADKSGVLADLKPEVFFRYFEEISRIPRGSYNEKQVSDYIAKFARDRGLECYQDDIHNILVKKPGTSGYENASPLIFHGHTDIVCESDEGVEHDFEKQGIKLRIDGDFIHGTGTTLGADNTVGVALALSVLDAKDIPHPPLEVVLTVQEEVGKGGAQHFDASRLTGRRLIDFNWHDPKSLFAGCAGDISARFRIPVEWQKAPAGLTAMRLFVKGLSSGHSEFDIHLERANAIVLLARVVGALLDELPVRLASVRGGVNRYVIPGDAEALLLMHQADVDRASEIVRNVAADIKKEFFVSDPKLEVGLEPSDGLVERVLSDVTANSVVQAITLTPNGVQSMSLTIANLVESSNTIALLSTSDEEVEILSTIPSAISSRRYAILKRIERLAELMGRGTRVTTFADCPEWPYNKDSKLLAVATRAFEDTFKAKPHVEVSHSSLELGLFNKKIPGIDMISIGPEAFDVHTTRERLNHTTVEPIWRLLKEILRNLRD